MPSGHAPPTSPVPMRITCPGCGYNLTGAVIGMPCPECGQTVGHGALATALPASGRATASLVLGIISIVGCSTYGILSVPTGIIAIALARGANDQIARNEVSPSSAGLAKAGMVCGIVGLCLGAPFVLFILAALLFGMFAPLFV